MFCPECKYEYNPEVTVCPDCNEMLVTEEELIQVLKDKQKVNASPLISELINLNIQSDVAWVHIARLNSQQMADMVLEVLHAKGIAAVIHSETGYFGITGQLGMSSYRPIGGGFSLFVDNNSVEDVDNEARVLLGDEWEKCKLIEIN